MLQRQRLQLLAVERARRQRMATLRVAVSRELKTAALLERAEQEEVHVLQSALQYGAVCCSVLQRVAMYCSVLQCVVMCVAMRFSVLQCVAVCCSVLQCVAMCCGAVQSNRARGARGKSVKVRALPICSASKSALCQFGVLTTVNS